MAHPSLVPPRLNLRKGVAVEKAPLSSTSSRFNFNHLAFNSPPPSPSLPRLVPAPRKRLQAPRRRRVLRVLLWISGFVCLWYFTRNTKVPQHIPSLPRVWKSPKPLPEFLPTKPDDLPKIPTPVLFTDLKGRAKWTVSIPPSADFPLSGSQYVEMCALCRGISEKVAKIHRQSPLLQEQHDDYYVDVHGIVPLESLFTPLRNVSWAAHETFPKMEIMLTKTTKKLRMLDTCLGA